MLVFACVAVQSPFGEVCPGISRMGGIILLVLFAYFLFNTFRHAKDHPEEVGDSESAAKPVGLFAAILLVLVGLAGLVIGGEMIVKSAVQIATDLGVSEAIIGLTVVALGTSLPELATSAMAAFKHNSDIALGNVIGSNIFHVAISSEKNVWRKNPTMTVATPRVITSGAVLLKLSTFFSRNPRIIRISP